MNFKIIFLFYEKRTCYRRYAVFHQIFNFYIICKKKNVNIFCGKKVHQLNFQPYHRKMSNDHYFWWGEFYALSSGEIAQLLTFFQYTFSHHADGKRYIISPLLCDDFNCLLSVWVYILKSFLDNFKIEEWRATMVPANCFFFSILYKVEFNEPTDQTQWTPGEFFDEKCHLNYNLLFFISVSRT